MTVEGAKWEYLIPGRAIGGRREALQHLLIPTLLEAICKIGTVLRKSHHVSVAGSANTFGDEQLNVDLLAENIIREKLDAPPFHHFVTCSSEEDPRETELKGCEGVYGDEYYNVAFDPLDGSSIIGPNFSVGTIIGIWEGRTALNQNPRSKQIGAILGVYGPRTSAVVALRIPELASECFEYSLEDAPGSPRGLKVPELIRQGVSFSEPPFKARYFAPANLRAASDDARYLRLVNHYIQEKYTLRYSGGLVPDVVHMLSKGHGVYISPVTNQSKAKLRRLYELAPIALTIEVCGGEAVDPTTGKAILDEEIADTDERGGLLCGAKEEVQQALAMLQGKRKNEGYN